MTRRKSASDSESQQRHGENRSNNQWNAILEPSVSDKVRGINVNKAKDVEFERMCESSHEPTNCNLDEDAKEASIFRESGWHTAVGELHEIPVHQRPRVVEDVDSFFHQLLYGQHMDDIVVLPNGMRKAGLQDCLPSYLSDNLDRFTNVQDLLCNIDDDILDKIDGHVYSFAEGREDEVVRKGSDGEPLHGLLQKRHILAQRAKGAVVGGLVVKNNGGRPETKMMMDPSSDRNSDDTSNDKKVADPADSGEIESENDSDEYPDLEGSIYITELQFRKEHKYRHPEDNRYTRTIVKRSAKDTLKGDQKHLPIYWDRYNEGGFLGSKFMGSPLHIDQCLWSNIGRNWAGYKIMAIWRMDDDETVDRHRRQLFSPPISEREKRALRNAVKIAFVRPGDMFFFSGANPHMAMCVSDTLSYTCYESFINSNPTHIDVFKKTNSSEHHEKFHMRDSTLKDIKYDIIDDMNDKLELIENNELSGLTCQIINNAAKQLRTNDSLMEDEIFSPRKSAKTLRSQSPHSDASSTSPMNL